MDKRLHIIIHGRVQGINYRYYSLQAAKKLNITGWVRNNPDSTVELIAEGKEEDLKLLLDWCRKGPTLAKVKKAEEQWEECKDEFSEFKIIYS